MGRGHQAAERRPFARWARATRTPAALAGAGLALALVVGGVLSAGVLAVPGGVPPVRATGATVPVAAGSPARATTTSPSRSVTSAPERGDPASPRTQPTGLMTELAALRARAMVSGDPADLVDLDAPGSVALARDTADLRSLREQGLGYEGVRLTVRSARPVTVATREATVEAVVDTAAYRVVSVRGVHRTVRTEGAVRGQALRFALVWSGGRWLIDRVEPVG